MIILEKLLEMLTKGVYILTGFFKTENYPSKCLSCIISKITLLVGFMRPQNELGSCKLTHNSDNEEFEFENE